VKKFLMMLAVLFVPSLVMAGLFSSGGSPDYSNNAGSTYVCAQNSSVTTKAGVSPVGAALALYNPPGSGKNLTVLEVGVDYNASPAAASGLFLAYNITPSTGIIGIGTLPNVENAVLTSTGGFVGAVAVCKQNVNLPLNPQILRFIGGTTGASAIGGVLLTDQTAGKVVVPPGGLISIQATSASAIWSHIEWREDNL